MTGNNLTTFFKSMKDPRINRTKRHSLQEIIIIAICAVICGANDWVAVENFGNSKIEWFKSFLDLENGIPSHDTFGRVFSALDAESFSTCFIQWVEWLAQTVSPGVIAIDGKTLRKSFDTASSKAAIHMVSAWSSANQLVLGQIKTEEKSNEITAIPKLLELLVISGAIITIDAMGCQKKIVEKIVEKGADYMIALKSNQGSFYNEVDQFFKGAASKDYNGITCDYYEEIDAGHGRIENRKTWTTGDIGWFQNKDKWVGLSSLVKIESTREIKGEISIENRYYISSLDGSDAKKAHNTVRSHWGVENGLHWKLDVGFLEDNCRVRNGSGAENFSVLRRIALNLLQQEKTARVGINNKRLMAGWDNRYLLKILNI